jgi:hypothetical protein
MMKLRCDLVVVVTMSLKKLPTETLAMRKVCQECKKKKKFII